MSKFEKTELFNWDEINHDELKRILFSLLDHLGLQAVGLKQPQYDSEYHMMEIAKCPYCSYELILDGGDYIELQYVVCDHCNAEGPKTCTRQQAIEAWNRVSMAVYKED